MTNLTEAYNNSKSPYHREAVRLVGEFETAATVTDGIVRWNSNNRVPPTEVLDLWARQGFEFAYWGSVKVRDRETTQFLADYRANYQSPSDEERIEARAAHGRGVVLVNAITGKKYVT